VTPEQERALRVLYRRSGVRRRGSVALEGPPEAPTAGPPFDGDDPAGPGTGARMAAYERHAPPLGCAAAAAALADAGIGPERVAHVVTVTCTGFMAPGLAVHLVRSLGLRSDVTRTQVGFMGCHGALVGLRTAAALAATTPGRAALVVAVELCSLHFQYGWDPGAVVANALFADGAGAAVVTTGRSGHGNAPVLAATGSWLAPGSEEAMTWRIGDRGFRMTLSPEVPALIRRDLRQGLEPWLEGQGLTVGDVGGWAVHPGGPRILTAVTEALDLDPTAVDISRSVLAEHGNMSSPTVLFVLDRLRSAGAPRPWVALGFGPGLTTEAALLA